MSGATKTRDERRIGWSYTVPSACIEALLAGSYNWRDYAYAEGAE